MWSVSSGLEGEEVGPAYDGELSLDEAEEAEGEECEELHR